MFKVVCSEIQVIFYFKLFLSHKYVQNKLLNIFDLYTTIVILEALEGVFTVELIYFSRVLLLLAVYESVASLQK